MKKLRSVHLYLGCIFAPVLLFFAVSGIWQMAGLGNSGLLQTLSTIHTMHGLKNKAGDPAKAFLSSPMMKFFVFAMAVSFILTTLLGVVLAVKHGGSRRAAYICLAFGVLFPLALVLIRVFA